MAPTSSTAPRNHGSGIPISRLRSEARELSAELFEDRHGSGFLMLTAAELRSPDGPSMTEVNLADDDEPGEHTAGLSLVAYPVRRSERSVGHLITIGRTANNDIVIPDISVSRFHAFAKPVAGGGFVLQDAGSYGTAASGTRGQRRPAAYKPPPYRALPGVLQGAGLYRATASGTRGQRRPAAYPTSSRRARLRGTVQAAGLQGSYRAPLWDT